MKVQQITNNFAIAGLPKAELHSVTLNEKPTTSQNIKFFPFVKPESTHLSSLKFKCSIRELHTILFLANSIKL